MRVWLVTFGILFGLAELYQWLKEFTLPLPVYVLGGAFLAIASNSDKGIFAIFNPEPLQSQRSMESTEAPIVVNEVQDTINPSGCERLTQSPQSSSIPSDVSQKPISFKISQTQSKEEQFNAVRKDEDNREGIRS